MQRDVLIPAAPAKPVRPALGARSARERSTRADGRPPVQLGFRPHEKADGIAFVDWRASAPTGRSDRPILPRDGLVLQVSLPDRSDGLNRCRDDQGAPERICRSAVILLDPRSHLVSRSCVGTIQIWLSGKVLREVSESMGLTDLDPGEALTTVHGRTLVDPTIHDLVASAVATLDRQDRGAAIFRVQLARALAAHLLGVYADTERTASPIRGGLAPWQLRRAKERILADLGDAPQLQAVAAECGLSVSHFARAFRQSTGASPHAWLVRQRVTRAKFMMRASDQPLAEIALACGFADQSHFTRVFAREEDMSPGRWRRLAEPDVGICIPEEALS